MAARGLIRDSFGLALSQYLSRAVLLGRGLATAACLGPTGFGAWNALTLILDYGSYASFGALNGLDLKLPPWIARHERALATRALRGAWWASLAGGVLFAAAVVVVLATGNWLSLTGWGWGAPALMLAAVFVQLAIQYHASALRAAGDFARVSAAGAVQALLGGGIGIVAVWQSGVWGLLWGWLAGGLASLILLRRAPPRPPLAPGHAAEGLKLAATGLPMLAFFAMALVVRSLDRMALVRFGGNDVLGLYSVGLIMAGLILYVPEAVAAVLFPRIAAAAQGARDPEATRREVARSHRALALLMPLVVGPGVLWAPPVLARLLPAFASGIETLRVLAIAALVLSTATLPSYYLLGRGRPRGLLVAAGIGVAIAALVIVGVASLDPRPLSVAWASTAGYAAFALALLAVATPQLAPAPRERVAMVAAALIPTGWAAGLLIALQPDTDVAVGTAARRSAAFLALYLPVVLAMGRRLEVGAAWRRWKGAK